jgi:hypothetical protein
VDLYVDTRVSEVHTASTFSAVYLDLREDHRLRLAEENVWTYVRRSRKELKNVAEN